MSKRFAQFPPDVWTSERYECLRGDPEAQALFAWLIACPHGSNTTGLHHRPLSYACIELGWPLEGASKGLRSPLQGGLVTYDEATEWLLVVDAFSWNVGETIKPGDRRVSHIKQVFHEARKSTVLNDFALRYPGAWEALGSPYPTPFEGGTPPPSKQRRKQRTEITKKKSPSDSAPEARTRKPNAHSAKLEQMVDVYKRHELEPPGYPLLGKWLKNVGGDVAVAIDMLEYLGNGGKLAIQGYVGRCSSNWQPRTGGRPRRDDEIVVGHRDFTESLFSPDRSEGES